MNAKDKFQTPGQVRFQRKVRERECLLQLPASVPPVNPLTRYPPFRLFLSGMKIDDQMIDNLAHLARLRFTDAEKDMIRNDLGKMVAFVEKLEELDTTGITPLLHIGDAVNVLREDKVEGSVSREAALLNAPLCDDRFFKVPKVIRK